MLEVLKHDFFAGVNSSHFSEEKAVKKKIVFEEKQKGEAIDMEQQKKKID